MDWVAQVGVIRAPACIAKYRIASTVLLRNGNPDSRHQISLQVLIWFNCLEVQGGCKARTAARMAKYQSGAQSRDACQPCAFHQPRSANQSRAAREPRATAAADDDGRAEDGCRRSTHQAASPRPWGSPGRATPSISGMLCRHTINTLSITCVGLH